jgi:predicted TIM-barrel fold metal-dependent hydrolase
MIDPTRRSGTLSVADMERQVKELGAIALKTYTGTTSRPLEGGWFLDDEEVSYPMLEEATRLGLRLINVHKGLPQILGPMAEEYVRSRDLPKVSRDWPRLSFVAYHSGYFSEGLAGNEEFLGVMRSMGRRHNVFAEIGSSWAITFSQGPTAAAHFIGSLLRDVGSSHIIWGTDSIWWGSPQWQIDAFKAFQIPTDMQEKFGYPPLTERDKRRIFGLNAARLYKIKVNEKRCEISNDQISQFRSDREMVEANRSLRSYGPRTRREFLALEELENPGA